MEYNQSKNEFDSHDEQQAFSLNEGQYYLAIQVSDDCYDYTIYYHDFREVDGGQLDEPDWTMEEAVQYVLESFNLAQLSRERYDYDTLTEHVTEVEMAQLAQARSQHASLAERIHAADAARAHHQPTISLRDMDTPQRD